MKLNLYVLTPKRIIWDCEVKEIILSTNSGQIGVLPNHAPINTAVDMGPLRIRLLDRSIIDTLTRRGRRRGCRAGTSCSRLAIPKDWEYDYPNPGTPRLA